MEEDRIGLVLVRVSELRSKVTYCIQKAFVIGDNEEAGRKLKGSEADAEYVDADEEADSLLNIRDALEALESQLAALQVTRFFSCSLCFWVFLFFFFLMTFVGKSILILDVV